MGKSTIQWTEETWNPIRGCSIISPGCHHCYAMGIAARFSKPGQPFHRLAIMTEHGPQWTGEVELVPDKLAEPLHWKKPRVVFANSMSDLFHEDLSFENIAAVHGIMAATPQHTYQVLTKRAKRAAEWHEWIAKQPTGLRTIAFSPKLVCADYAKERLPGEWFTVNQLHEWPLPNVWLGTSAESQKYLDERAPYILRAPAAIHFVSLEPLLEGVDLTPWLVRTKGGLAGLDWVIVGGESGRGARAFNPTWAKEIIRQCATAKVACFVKQLGANVLDFSEKKLKDGHGGDMREWPAELRIREFPKNSLQALSPTPAKAKHCGSHHCVQYRHPDRRACGCGCDACSRLSAHLRPPTVEAT